MFDKDRFKFALESYKKNFSTWFAGEKYKWEVVKCFQDNWNIDADDFKTMLENSLQKLNQKLIYGFAKDTILWFAKNDSKTVREMFKELFDENNKISERLKTFSEKSEELFKKYQYKNSKNSHQTNNTISAYLWLRYPDKYYLYSAEEKVRVIAEFLKSEKINNIEKFYNLYDEICEELKQDNELIDIFKKQITDGKYYSDSELKTLTVDFGYYVTHNYDSLLKNWQNKIGLGKITLPVSNFGTYTKENFLAEVFISEEKYKTIRAVLERKKNIILQGAPGVGKTFAAKRLAYSIIGEKNENLIEFVQFHQNYSYEDFIMGYKPTENSFELKTGIFYNFCKKAESEPNKKFFFIIDEINRGNLSKIFGELLMLIESDKRGKEKFKLAYNDENFSVPENLFIIGMMNTADRSLAMIDYALRRRFSFIEMNPAFDSDGFKNYQQNLNDKTFDKLIEQIKILNSDISADNALGKGFCIGHSYFCDCKIEDLRSIVEYEILPMLEEYYFDNQSKLEHWKNNLRGVFDE